MKQSVRRNESIEGLRLISCFFIILLHVCAPIRTSVVGTNRYLFTILNSICNTGVSCFVLISGYFGVKLKWKRVLQLIIIASGYSILAFTITRLTGAETGWEIGAIVKAAFPILFNQNWFICCYIALLFLSPFVNDYLNSIDIRKHFILCATLLIIFGVIPTFFYYELPGTNCKGLFHIILMYTVGRLIGRTGGAREKINKKFILLLLVGSFALTISLNSLLLYFTGEAKEYFSRDCSLFIIASSVLLFLLTLKMNNAKVRFTIISQYCLDIYLIHDALVIKLLNMYFFDYSAYLSSWKIIAVIFVEGIMCLGVSYGIGCVCNPFFRWLSDKVYTVMSFLWKILYAKLHALCIK